MARKPSSKPPAEKDSASGRRFVGALIVAPIPFVIGLAARNAWVVLAAQWWHTALAAGMIAGTAAGLSWLAYHISKRAKREPLIRWQATATMAACGVDVLGTMLFGITRPWIDVVGWMSLAVAVSWSTRHFDPMRSETREDDSSGSKLDDAFGLANTKVIGKPKLSADGAAVEVRFRHADGGTPDDVQSAIKAIEAHANAPRGLSRLVPNPEKAGESELTLVMTDLLKSTVPWPGPSHPGGLATDPIHIGVYQDGQPGLLWLPGEPDVRPLVHLLEMGMTGTGKTRAGLVILVELLTRRGVCVAFADTVKGKQTVGPVKNALTLYANTDLKVKRLFKGLERVIAARADALGDAGYSEWVPACYDDPRLKMPLLVVHLEEADLYINNDEFEFLASKARSTGVELICSLQRADHSNMPTNARFNFGGAMCFGCGDPYSASFALSESVINAGANPDAWRNRKPGYFYLETAGVDETRFPVPLKAYLATNEQIAAALAANAHHRATLDQLTITALGEAWTDCQPDAEAVPAGPSRRGGATIMNGEFVDNGYDGDGFGLDDAPGFDDGDGPGGRVDPDLRARIAAEVALEREEMGDELNEEVEQRLADSGYGDGATPAAGGDAKQPLPAFDTDDDFDFPDDGRPDAATTEEAIAAFDEVIVGWWRAGKLMFVVDDLAKALPLRHRSWHSKRLAGLAADEKIIPPGIKLRREDNKSGVYHIETLAMAGAHAGNGSHPGGTS